METFEKLFAALDDDLRRARAALAETEEKIAEVNGYLRTLKLAGEPPTEEELLAARGYREQGWALVRSAWFEGKRDEAAEATFNLSDPLELAYEKSVRKADDLADRMRREAEKVAHRVGLLADRTQQQERAETLSGGIGQLEERRGGLEKDWESRWAPVGFIPLSPQEMRGWRSDWKDLARRAAEGRKLDGRVRKLAEEIQESKKALWAGLAVVEEPLTAGEPSLETILLRAEELVQAAKDLRVKRDQLARAIEEARRGKSQAEEEEKKQAETFARWEKDWSGAVKGLSVDLPVSAAAVFLDKCQALMSKLEEAEKNQTRIDNMKRDIQAFEGRVKDFVAPYAPDLIGGRVDQTVRDLSDRVSKAKADAASQANLSAERSSRLKDLDSAWETIRLKSKLLDSLRREAGCREEVEFPEAETRSEAACSLDDRIRELKKQILVLAAGRKVEVFTGEVEGEDPERVLQELASEVEKYREKSQGPVLKRAGELFAPLTQKVFIGLEPDYSAGDEPILVGIRENGEKVTLAGMSDGTQDQIYLALRLASLEHFIVGGIALPLLVDDALVNFDDHRARAALQLLEDLGNKTQVIFLTHHRHMVELAREAIDGETLHVQELIEQRDIPTSRRAVEI
jgi:hypothetical protein